MIPINVLIIETQQRTFNQTYCISISAYRKSDIPLSSSAERNNKRGNTLKNEIIRKKPLEPSGRAPLASGKEVTRRVRTPYKEELSFSPIKREAVSTYSEQGRFPF